VIYNLPPEPFGLKSSPAADPASFLTDEHLVVCTTRLAMDDDPDTKKPLLQTRSSLEQEIHGGYRTIFRRCERSAVILSENVARAMAKRGYDASYRAIQFEQVRGGRSIRRRDTDDVGRLMHAPRLEPAHNIGYIAYLPRISASIAAGMVAVFSIDGTSTELWADFVARRYADSLVSFASGRSPRLLLGEFCMEFPGHVPYIRSEVKFELLEDRTIDVVLDE
jgi:hypothetical protein